MSYWLFRLATALAPLLPPPFGYWLFARAGDLLYLFDASGRARHIKNLKRVFGDDAPRARLNDHTRKAYQNLLKNYFDLFRGHRLTPQQVRAQLADVSGLELLEAALAQGKGVIGGSAHFGNFNLFLHLTAVSLKDRYEIVVPVERIRPARLFEFLKGLRASQGIHIVPVDTASRLLIKTLRAGQIIGLALDFDPTGSGPVVNFFGAPARLPDGAVALSLKYGAPVIAAFIRRMEDNRSAVAIEPPLQFENTGDLARDTLKGVEQVARLLEKWIRAHRIRG